MLCNDVPGPEIGLPVPWKPNPSCASSQNQTKKSISAPRSGTVPTQNPDLLRKMAVRTVPRDPPGERVPKNKIKNPAQLST